MCSGGKQWGGSDDSKHRTQTRVTPEHTTPGCHSWTPIVSLLTVCGENTQADVPTRNIAQQYTEILSTAFHVDVSFMYPLLINCPWSVFTVDTNVYL